MQVGVHLVLPKKTQSRPRKYLWNICDASGILLGGELQGELERIRQVLMTQMQVKLGLQRERNRCSLRVGKRMSPSQEGLERHL